MEKKLRPVLLVGRSQCIKELKGYIDEAFIAAKKDISAGRYPCGMVEVSLRGNI
jgi:hypothetical protein